MPWDSSIRAVIGLKFHNTLLHLYIFMYTMTGWINMILKKTQAIIELRTVKPDSDPRRKPITLAELKNSQPINVKRD